MTWNHILSYLRTTWPGHCHLRFLICNVVSLRTVLSSTADNLTWSYLLSFIMFRSTYCSQLIIFAIFPCLTALGNKRARSNGNKWPSGSRPGSSECFLSPNQHIVC
ncbi:unnamed protein product [Nezara viridula]|uniref:Uncharacterized protein n=1 Tax=Nezara viridula TaxID=85310 RepID=A0A9P0E5A2_NEZVI|nr:unnamed protein product [Nezara viridula]